MKATVLDFKTTNILYKTKMNSTAIKNIKIGKSNLTLTFFNGTYIYKNVPKDVMLGFIKAESKGKYFNDNIKGKYEHEKKN